MERRRETPAARGAAGTPGDRHVASSPGAEPLPARGKDDSSPFHSPTTITRHHHHAGPEGRRRRLRRVERKLARRGEAAVAALAPVKPLAARRRELNVLLERQKREQARPTARSRADEDDRAAGENARAGLRALGTRQGQRGRAREVEARIRRCCCWCPTRRRTPSPPRRRARNVQVSVWARSRPTRSSEAALGAGRGARHPRVAAAAKLSGSRFTISKGRRRGWSGPWPASSWTCTPRAATSRSCHPTGHRRDHDRTASCPSSRRTCSAPRRGAALPHPHRRGPGHQHAPDEIFEAGRCPSPTAPGPVLPRRGRRRRARHRGLIRQHQFPQGGAGEVRHARAPTPSTRRCSTTPARVLPGSGCTTGWCSCARRHGLLVVEDLRHRGLVPRSGGLPGDQLGLQLRGLQPGASGCATAAPTASRGSATPSTARGWRWADVVAILEQYQQATGRC